MTLRELNEALTCCMFHYTGGMFESLSLEECPCKCACKNCEMIPETPVLIRMQDIGNKIKEENVLFEFLKELNEKKTIGQSAAAHDTNDVIPDS